MVISVIGLGYVGLPLAEAFAAHFDVVGFDINEEKTLNLQPRDRLRLTSDEAELAVANFHIVAVPTPVDNENRPDIQALISAAEIVGRHLKKGDIVVFESSVYPGCTEDECVPALEKTSGLKSGVDFGVGYSPERINPGDNRHALSDVVKIVAAADAKTLEIVAQTYGKVVAAGLHRAPNIRVAPTAKLLEHTQRDVNIALINEMSLICRALEIDTQSVIDAAATKWNFAPYKPGLVGGHCIGVDPFYLSHVAERHGYSTKIVSAARKLNDAMGQNVAASVVKRQNNKGLDIRTTRILVMGLPYKEDVADIRNSRSVDIVRELESYGVDVALTDPLADKFAAKKMYNIDLAQPDGQYDAVVVAVAHSAYKTLNFNDLAKLLKPEAVIFDVKGIWREKITNFEYLTL